MYLAPNGSEKVANPKNPRAGTQTADMATDSPFGAQSPVFESGRQNMGKINTKSKWEKINTFYGLPNLPVCFRPRSKHGRRQIPGSRFKSFGVSAAATKLIRCRRNFLKNPTTPDLL